MSKVYLVSMGCYSDYSVSGVFSTKEKAEQWMTLCGGEFNELDEMELDEGFTEIERGLALFSVRITKGGDVVEVKRGGYPNLVEPIRYWQSRERFFDDGGFRGREVEYDTSNHRTTVYVWAEDESHAIKVANERRIAALADPSVKTYP